MVKVNIDPKKMGLEILKLREMRKFTLEQVSKESGLSLAYLQQLESGDIEKIRKKELRRLSKALRLPVPCVKMLGIESDKISDKWLSRLALAVQNVIYVCVKSQDEVKKKKK